MNKYTITFEKAPIKFLKKQDRTTNFITFHSVRK